MFPEARAPTTICFLQGEVSWEPDFWGNIRRAVESQRATAQATAADLANVDLSVRSELATDYFEMRGLDTQQRLLDNTVVQYEQYLQLTQARFKGGVATDSDVALAQTQAGPDPGPGHRCRRRAGPVRTCHRHAHRCPRVEFWSSASRRSICNCRRYRWACLRNCWSAVRMLPRRNGAPMRPMPR